MLSRVFFVQMYKNNVNFLADFHQRQSSVCCKYTTAKPFPYILYARLADFLKKNKWLVFRKFQNVIRLPLALTQQRRFLLVNEQFAEYRQLCFYNLQNLRQLFSVRR
jgi:hypothetical protein